MKLFVSRVAAVAATVLTLAGTAGAQSVASADASEYLIKAGVVYNFAKLVEWPAAVAPKGQPIVIGVLGNDDFAAVLSRIADGKKVDDRPFVVKRLRTNEPLKDCGCRMLFVAASQTSRTEEIVQLQNSASVLTIAEGAEFARRGGVIALTLQDSKVRFAVNVDAAAQASLTISSRLLSLATIVHTAR